MTEDKLPVLIPKEISDYIYDNGICVDEDTRYINLPMWFKKLPDGRYAIIPFKELPNQCKYVDIISNLDQ